MNAASVLGMFVFGVAGLLSQREAWAQCAGAAAQLASVSTALSLEETSKAGDILEAVEKLSPQCAEIELDRGRIFYLRGDSANAEETLVEYAQQWPDDARGYAYLAQVLVEEGKYQRADDASNKALEKDPALPVALAIRGEILAMAGQSEEGTALLARACQLDAKDAEAHFQLGTLYARATRRTDAAAEFEKSLALVPGNASAWDYLALNLEPLGQIDGADAAYRKGIAVNWQGRHYDRFLDYNYGRFLTKRNQLKEARIHLTSATELAPSVRAVWYERAKVDMLLKDYPTARVDAETASSLPDPGGVILDLQVYALLEQIYSRLGEQELANKYAELSRRTSIPMQEGR